MKKEIRVDIYIDGKSTCDYIDSSKVNSLMSQLEQYSVKMTSEPEEKNMLAWVNGEFYQYTNKSPFALLLLSSSLDNANHLMQRKILKHKTCWKYHIELSMILGVLSVLIALVHPSEVTILFSLMLFLLQGYFLYRF